MTALANRHVYPIRSARLFTIGFLLTTMAGYAWSYEQATHAAITREAYVRARIGADASALGLQFGVQDPRQISLGETYIDIAPSGPILRFASPPDVPNFSSGKTKSVNQRSSFKPELDSVAGWLMLGAIREDDVPFDAGALENNPQDEPGGTFTRVLHHFFDPVKDRPLTGGAPLGFKAPDWGLLNGLVAAESGREISNHFTIGLAREAMWRALTLKKIDPTGALVDISDFPLPVEAERYLRDLRFSYWATTFRALGDNLHLLQDMAQPQHVRNDPHSGLYCNGFICPGGHASYYEKYVDARAIDSRQIRLRERFFSSSDPKDLDDTIVAPDLVFAGYPAVSFPRYRDFFATAAGGSSPSGGGLANYSNQGFFSAGTNIDSFGGGYPSPSPNVGSMQTVVIPEGAVTNAAAETVTGSLTLYKGTVRDSLNPGNSDSAVALSSHGAFDQFMQPTGSHQYTLNHYNYEDQARLLIPRAVAYSAGFLDYFFRGTMEINLPTAGAYTVVDHTTEGCEITCGFRRVKLRVRNSTPNETLSNGFFAVVLKFFRNKSYKQDLSGDPGGPGFAGWEARSSWDEIVVSDKVDIGTLPSGQLDPNTEAEISFSLPKPLPINATDIYLQVVFRGQLGNEKDAVVVATKNISEPNYIAVVNDMDYKYDDTTDTFQSIAPDLTQTISNISITLGNATTPVATLDQLPVRGYAQIAFLTDIPATGNEKLVVYSSLPSPITYYIPISTFDSPGGTIYQRRPVEMIHYRGMWSDFRMDNFVGAWVNQFNMIICTEVGDPRAICTSAGLTPITQANAVPWTINFP